MFEDNMDFGGVTLDLIIPKNSNWELHFAWLPVTLRSGRRVWLKSVYIRTGWKKVSQESSSTHSYTIIESMHSIIEYDDDFGILQDAGRVE